MADRLFAVYLGGRAEKCNTELHDVVFVIGESIEATYEKLMDKWFGIPDGLHLDSWMELDVVDGHRIILSAAKPANDKKLFFINLGAYAENEFTEIHANKLIVASSLQDAKKRGKALLLQNWPTPVHTDNLFDLDDCFEVGEIDGRFITLEETDRPENLRPTNGYHLVPKSLVEEYMKRRA